MRKILSVAVVGALLSFNSILLAEEATKLAKEMSPSSPAAASSGESTPRSVVSQDPALPSVSATPSKETVWLDDDLPAGAKAEGTWVWDTATFNSGAKSHGHASAKGLQSHGFSADPVTIPLHGMITQQAWLDPKDAPKGIMLKFKLASGEEVGVYWEGEEEVFNPAENEEVWYYGLLPELGKWVNLDVLAEDLGIEEEKVTGVTFATFDGRVLWDKMALTQAPPSPEENLPDDAKGTNPLTEE